MTEEQWRPKPTPQWTCSHCKQSFPYMRIDNQISDSWYLYCAECGGVGLLTSRELLPSDIYQTSGYELAAEAESFVPACECGGKFTHGALPRCPSCRTEIPRDAMIEMLDYFYSKREWSAATDNLGSLQHCIYFNDHFQYLDP